MARMIFVNLPVSDLPRAVRFYESVGFTKNPEFSDDTAAGMVLTEVIHVMLLTHEKFSSFTTRPIATRDVIEVSNCLSCETRAEVDALVDKAIAGGGRADPMPAQDYGFMYFRQFEDPDGHVWEVMFMDLAGFRAAKAGESVPA